jgi:ParB-like chromosome segregation protein Spo0J
MIIRNITEIKPNPNNPRIIKDEKFFKLVQSIKDFPDMLNKRPLVCVTDKDGLIFPLGGNMRLRAAKELDMKTLPVEMADDWTEEQRRQFIIKDNVGFGEWNWEELANGWDSEQLNEWGLDVPNFNNDVNLDDFFNEDNVDDKLPTNKIILEYTMEECDRVKAELLKHGKTPEDAVYNLLGL